MTIQKPPIETNGNCFKSTSTPTSNKSLCKVVKGPKKVVPIIFIPGIMGSNIVSDSGDEVWFPANGVFNGLWSAITGGLVRDAQTRQTELDPKTTKVSNKGDINIKRSHNLSIDEDIARARGWGSVWWDGYGKGLIFLERYLNNELIADPEESEEDDYEPEDSFKGSYPWSLFTTGSGYDKFDKVQGKWNPKKSFQFLNNSEFGNLADYIFPVFAEGYNWLQNNSESAKLIATNMSTKIKAQVAKEFPNANFHKFIIVTHSMGGLVTRSLINQASVSSDIMGVVHGVMPASGAPTVYKRLASGWDGYKTSGQPVDAIAKYVFGATAEKLTPVLANSPGGMSLLPFKNFLTTNEDAPTTKIKPWLRLRARNLNGDIVEATLPKENPYEEIYSDVSSWWQMVDLGKLDPTGSIKGTTPPPRVNNPSGGGFVGDMGGGGLYDPSAKATPQNQATDLGANQTQASDLGGGQEEAKSPELKLAEKLLDTVQQVEIFQDSIADSYHSNTFAHYGNDPKHLAFNEVVWETDQKLDIQTEDDLINYTGMPRTTEKTVYNPETGIHEMPPLELYPWDRRLFEKDGVRRIERKNGSDVVFKLNIKPNKVTGYGDGTVCNQSAEDVNREAAKQVFLINGYEHASSYANKDVLNSVLYSIAKIIKPT